MPPVGRPVHRIDLGEMALQCPLRPHQLVLGDRLVGLGGDGADWFARRAKTGKPAISHGAGHTEDTKRPGATGHSRVVSASSSFFLLILSFSVSASRRACWMRACIASGDTSLGRPGSIFCGCAWSIEPELANGRGIWRRWEGPELNAEEVVEGQGTTV